MVLLRSSPFYRFISSPTCHSEVLPLTTVNKVKI